MTPAQRDGKWFVVSREQEVAGPFDTNAEAWRWIDRNEGAPVSKSEERGISFRQINGGVA